MSSQYCKPSGSDPVWRCPVCGQWWQLGEQDVQTVTQEVRQTGDVKRLCMTVKTGERIDAMSCELIDPLSGGVK